MRFLADENFPNAAVTALVEAGCDVVAVRKDAAGMRDTDVLAWIIRDNRILLTFDRDFGELARNTGLPQACGIRSFSAADAAAA